MNAAKPFELIEYLANEDSYLVWSVAIDNLNYILNVLHSTDIYENFKKFLLDSIIPKYGEIEFENGSNITNNSRIEIAAM